MPMYFSEQWGWYVHPPKTGGVSFRHWLNLNFGGGKEIGKFHDIPQDTKGFPVITTVRNPVDWIDSVYRYRVWQDWVEKDEGIGWNAIIALTQWGKGLTWDEFAEEVYRRDVDIPYVVFNLFTMNAKVYKIEDVGALHRNSNPTKSVMTLEQREMLGETFIWSMEKYKYTRIV